jgi:hypothetical protein
MYYNLRLKKSIIISITLISVVLAASLAVIVLAVPSGSGVHTESGATVTFKLVDLTDGNLQYSLTVTIPASLVNYYGNMNHVTLSEGDFGKYVTPIAVKPIADALRQAYPNDEDFTNAVLELVHQTPYQFTAQSYYPIETLFRDKGDCDLVTTLAASILKAGGLDVVLLDYPTQKHMNIGVHLNQDPTQAQLGVTYVVSHGVKYYVAETTGSNWRQGWRVGESPDDLKGPLPTILTFGSDPQNLPSQLTATLTQVS